MNRDEAREAAIDDYRLRFGEVKGHELDAVVFGFNRGYQAGSEGRWVPIRSVDDLPKEDVPAGYFVMPSFGFAEIWYRKPDVSENTEAWLRAKAWMPIPAYKED